MGYLHAEGKNLINDGKPVFLRGAGLGGWLLPEGYMWKLEGHEDRPRRIERLIETLCGAEYADSFWERYYATYIQEKDFAWLARWGFNCVRLPINARHLLQGGELNPEYLSHIDDALRWSKKYGIFLFLDCHGAPGGQTGTNIDDSENDYPSLFDNPEYERQLTLLWCLLAKRYRNETAIGGFDLLNEPITHWHTDLYPKLVPLYRRLIKEIRAIDPNHLLVLEGTHWATDFSVFSAMSPAEAKENLLFEFHKYWSAPDHNSLLPYLSFRDNYDVPLWDGESGENNRYWYSLLFSLFERENISWCFWAYKKMANANSLSSFAIPQGWNEILTYTETGKSPANPTSIFNSFLDSLTKARFHYETARAILRQAPTSIPGEGYDFARIHKSQGQKEGFRQGEPVPLLFLDGHQGIPDYAKYAGEPQKKSDALAVLLKPGDEVFYYFSAKSGWLKIQVRGTGDFLIFVNGDPVRNGTEIWNNAPLSKCSILLKGNIKQSLIESLAVSWRRP